MMGESIENFNKEEIFKDYLESGNSFIAIETEVFSGKLNINKPINELRVIGL